MNNRLPIRRNKSILFLASLLIVIVALAIGQSGWTDSLSIVVFVGFGAIFVGLLISRSLFPPLIAHFLSAVIGASWSFWVVSRLLASDLSFRSRWETMASHVANWFVLAQKGGIIYDNLMFILQMSFVVWILGYLTIWFLFRSSKIWGAVIPGGVVLLINLYYAPQDLTSWFITYLLLALLLIVRFNLFEHENRWRLEHVYFRSDISFDFLRNGLIFSVVIVALAWFTPAVNQDTPGTVFDRFDRQWRNIQIEWNRLFAGLNYKPQTTSNPNAYAQSHALGGARRLNERLVMYVDAPEGRYWRAAVYDHYDGNTWNSNDSQEIRFSPSNMGVSLPQYEARETITQTYTTLQDGLYILYAMVHPTSIDRVTVGKTNFLSGQQIVNAPQGQWVRNGRPWGEEITYIESDARLKQGESYQVISQRTVAAKEQLRADLTEYPDWITQKYLKIPDDTPQRVLDLAQEITRQADNAYDQAEAIERFMRNQIEYNEQIQAPPANRDKVDYILFDLKQGYCDYYATSMIVLLRSLGIPARFAAGYARGREETLDNQEKVFAVRNLDAHSWVEVFFPTYGWIEFEPTAAQPNIIRQSNTPIPYRNPNEFEDFMEDNPFDPLDSMNDEPFLGDLEGTLDQNIYNFSLPFLGEFKASKTIVNWSVIGLLVFVVGTVGWRTYSSFYESQRQDSVTGDVYFAMLRLAHWMGLTKRPSQTPYEHAAILTENLPPIKTEVNLITDEFVRHEISPKPTTEVSKSKVTNAWEDIRPVLYRAIFERRIPKIKNPFKR